MIVEDTYKELSGNGEGLYKEKGSKFIAHAFSVYSEEDVKEELENMKKRYHDARHHCYAYMIGTEKSVFRANDDGEPSGTAGKPILNQILSKELTNVCVVVIRYFGGTKLGVSGLITAYKTAAREALDNATIVEKTIDKIFALHFDYPMMNEVMRIMKEENLEQHNSKFELDCYFEIQIRKNDADRIFEKFQNLYGLNIKYLETR
jgi:uncharacterized YigZ family protein